MGPVVVKFFIYIESCTGYIILRVGSVFAMYRYLKIVVCLQLIVTKLVAAKLELQSCTHHKL